MDAHRWWFPHVLVRNLINRRRWLVERHRCVYHPHLSWLHRLVAFATIPIDLPALLVHILCWRRLVRVLWRRIDRHRLESCRGVDRLLHHSLLHRLRVHRLAMRWHHLTAIGIALGRLLRNILLRLSRWRSCHLLAAFIRTNNCCESCFLISILQLQSITCRWIIFNLVGDSFGFHRELRELRILLVDLYCVSLEVVLEGRSDAMLLFIELEHFVGVPAIGLCVQFQADSHVAILSAFPLHQLLLSESCAVHARRNGRVGLKSVANRVI